MAITDRDAAATLWPDMAKDSPGSASPKPQAPAGRAKSAAEIMYPDMKPELEPEPARKLTRSKLATPPEEVLWGEDGKGLPDRAKQSEQADTSSAAESAGDDASEAKAESSSAPGDSDDETPRDLIEITRGMVIEAPRDVELDEEALNGFAPIVQKYGVPKEAAQELVDLHANAVASQVQAFSDNQLAEFQAMQAEDRAATLADPALKAYPNGGIQGALQAAKAVFHSELVTPEFRQMAGAHGIKDNPEFIKFLVSIHALIGVLQKDAAKRERTAHQLGRFEAEFPALFARPRGRR